jgi:hypothetical protein
MAANTTRDTSAIVLENELLTNEVRHLRSELQRKTGEKQPKAEGNPAAKASKKGDPDAGHKDQALEDIVWLVNRLQHSPARFLFGRKAGYRTLVERYGN